MACGTISICGVRHFLPCLCCVIVHRSYDIVTYRISVLLHRSSSVVLFKILRKANVRLKLLKFEYSRSCTQKEIEVQTDCLMGQFDLVLFDSFQKLSTTKSNSQ
jgi:hypothetical protein